MRGGVALGLVGVLALTTMAACGDDDDSGSTTTTAPHGDDRGRRPPARPRRPAPADASGATEADYLAAIEGVHAAATDEPPPAHRGAGQVRGAEVARRDRRRPAQGEGRHAGRHRCRRPTTSDWPSLGLSEDEGNELDDAFGDCDVDLRAEFVESIIAGSTEVAADSKAASTSVRRRPRCSGCFVMSITEGRRPALDAATRRCPTDVHRALASARPTTSTELTLDAEPPGGQ